MDESRRLATGRAAGIREDLPARRRLRHLAEVPGGVRESQRYKDVGDFSVDGLARQFVGRLRPPAARHRRPLAGQRPRGQEAAARDQPRRLPGRAQRELVFAGRACCSASAPSCAPAAPPLSLTYMASERVVPGYGGGMSSAKAALESDTRTLAFEAGRKWGIRVNTITAGPYASRAASAIGIIEKMVEYVRPQRAAHRQARRPWRSAHAAAFLSSPSRHRHHRHHGVRGQGLPRHGHGGGCGTAVESRQLAVASEQ